MGGYAPPAWGGRPGRLDGWGLEVLRGGASLGVTALSPRAAGFTLLGRGVEEGNADGDVPLAHPSCSRLHAVLQFHRARGRLFLHEPGSTHGTWLNKRRLPGPGFHELRPGDVLGFGASSRLYVVAGPEAEDPPAARLLLGFDEPAAAPAAAPEGPGPAAAAEAATWGMSDALEEEEARAARRLDEAQQRGDLHVDLEGNLDWRKYHAEGRLSEKQLATVEKIRAKEYKLLHLQEEVRRIEAKEAGQREGLTEGQQATVARNLQRAAKLEAELEAAEESLRDAVEESLRARGVLGGGGEAGPSVKKAKRRALDDDDDDDTFYDRTGSKPKPKRAKLSTAALTLGAAGFAYRKALAGAEARREAVGAAEAAEQRAAASSQVRTGRQLGGLGEGPQLCQQSDANSPTRPDSSRPGTSWRTCCSSSGAQSWPRAPRRPAAPSPRRRRRWPRRRRRSTGPTRAGWRSPTSRPSSPRRRDERPRDRRRSTSRPKGGRRRGRGGRRRSRRPSRPRRDRESRGRRPRSSPILPRRTRGGSSGRRKRLPRQPRRRRRSRSRTRPCGGA